MIPKQESLTSTVTIQYQYKVHPDYDVVTKVATASFKSTYLNPYEFRDYRPIHLLSYLPIDAADIQNVKDSNQVITHLKTTQFCGFGCTNVLVTLFSLQTSVTYYDEERKYYVTSHWQKFYRMDWRIPSYFRHCSVVYSLKKLPLQQVNDFTARNDSFLSVRILSDQREKKQTQQFPAVSVLIKYIV